MLILIEMPLPIGEPSCSAYAVEPCLRCSLGTALLSSQSASGADAYPDRPVTLIVPSTPGGTTDFTARLLAEGLTRELGQQFIVDNKGGASGNIGIGQAARAEPDGYNLLLTYSGYQVTNPSLFKNIKWDAVKDFAPIALVIKAPHVFLVKKDLPVNSIAELITYGKEHPGELNFASSGNGSLQHIGAEQFMQQTGIDMTHVPYKGAGPAMTDLLGAWWTFSSPRHLPPLVTFETMPSRRWLLPAVSA